MKRLALSDPTSIDGLHVVDDATVPKIRADEILVRVRASSINFHDYLVVTGVLPTAAGRIPLSDGVGEVIECGSAAHEFAVGDRVLGTFFPDWLDGAPSAENTGRMRGEHIDGFACEFAAGPVTSFTRAPSHLSDAQVATLPCAALTAWRALMVEDTLKPGETVLIEGTGGVSVFALQFAKAVGANVVAVSSSGDKLERLRELGADHAIDHGENPAWGEHVRRVTDGGVEHVVEVLGGDLTQVIAASRPGAKIHMIGSLRRHPTQFRAGAITRPNIKLIGLTVGSRRQQQDMVRAIEATRLLPVVDRIFPLEATRDAFQHQADRGQIGKICIAI